MINVRTSLRGFIHIYRIKFKGGSNYEESTTFDKDKAMCGASIHKANRRETSESVTCPKCLNVLGLVPRSILKVLGLAHYCNIPKEM